jgi:hypothetical protein
MKRYSSHSKEYIGIKNKDEKRINIQSSETNTINKIIKKQIT